MNLAVDDYYTRGYGQKAEVHKGPSINTKKIEQFFNAYKHAQTSKIEIDGVQKFFEDMGVDPMDIVTLLISYHMKAQTMGEYSFDEFDCGCKTMGVQSI